VSIAFVLLAACIKPRDFHDPAQRAVRGTAWTLEKGTVAPSIAVGGVDSAQLLVDVGAAWAPWKHVEGSVNVAHFGGGLANLGLRTTLVERERWALGAGLSATWLNTNWMWYLDSVDPEATGADSDLDVVVVPLYVNSTWTLADWIDVTGGVSYAHAEAIGTIESEAVLFGGDVGSRRLALDGRAQVYVGRVAIWAGGSLPFGEWVLGNIATEIVLDDGVVVGTRTDGWLERPFGYGWSASGGAQLLLGQTYLDVGVGSSAASRAIGFNLSPYLAAHWRL
jgi:hypothetical protein